MSNLFWIRSPNFGDAINPLLYKAITGKEPTWSEPSKVPGTVLAIGSLVHCAYPGSILWGTGMMAEDLPPEHCDKTTIARAVRGPLTAWNLRKKGIQLSNTVFADPAILFPRYYTFSRPVHTDEKCLVIPHYTDVGLAVKYDWGPDWEVLSPMKDAEFLLKRIALAATVITSSLHILIVAEAYNVPAVWVEFSDDVHGGGFKFVDYYLSTIRHWPEPVQIRNDKIPWDAIYNRVYDWAGPGVDFQELGDLLMDVCPFA
jgi:pyruvyltransferase